MHLPSKARFLSEAEWNILTGVFGDTLPFRRRILLTDGLGGGDAPFTIPTSAISFHTLPAAIQAVLSGLALQYLGGQNGALAQAMNAVGSVGPGALLSQLSSIANLGYLVNVGPLAFPDMTGSFQNLLVHELTHVWQGKNSLAATTYVVNSIMHQCRASVYGSSRDGAYNYPAGLPWPNYNTEEQASIVEHWFASGMPENGDLWPYIRDYVRHGLV